MLLNLQTTANNTVISPNFLVWKLGEITVFFAFGVLLFHAEF